MPCSPKALSEGAIGLAVAAKTKLDHFRLRYFMEINKVLRILPPDGSQQST